MDYECAVELLNKYPHLEQRTDYHEPMLYKIPKIELNNEAFVSIKSYFDESWDLKDSKRDKNIAFFCYCPRGIREKGQVGASRQMLQVRPRSREK